jgi:glyoxylase-like metal-dependent hydrolase (beta-lactamase superfamily II)
VSHVVNTHWHWDHSGGLRTAVAKGIPILAPDPAVEMVERMARHEKTVVPDSLAKHPAEPRLIPVKDRYTLTGKMRSIELYAIGNIHAEGMLLIYLPHEKLVFSADLFNPGLFPTHGVGGWLQRAVINSVSPFSLLKAGTYALDLERTLDRLGLAVESLCGAHGPDVVPREELSVLSAYGDPEKFEAAVGSGGGGSGH